MLGQGLSSSNLINNFRKQLKNGQTVISMSPGHCKTDMGK